MELCAELFGVNVATVREVTANVEPYIRGRHQDLEPHAASAATTP
jgi:hypothetical protein